MLSFGTCDGNLGGFTVCADKNNLGILVVAFIPKRTRFELPFICCGGHFRKQMYSICICFQDYYYCERKTLLTGRSFNPTLRQKILDAL